MDRVNVACIYTLAGCLKDLGRICSTTIPFIKQHESKHEHQKLE